ncbi:MAG TPA: protein-L-isoaspartate O-methyltransferase, partial [Cryomorphaceae bacterium]|nr:protein-L-isoaspartate O-methyltransferase [Cryomorphaceae bacterium]
MPRSINDIATIYAGTFIVSWLYMDTKEDMIQEQLKGRGISDERVLNAMKTIDRELFVPDEYKEEAYRDGPLPIGRGQTISQPYIVAYMAQVLNPDPDDKILEVGSGCGYNAAVLSQLAAEVYSVEIVEWLAKFARENLNSAGIKNVKVRHGDGYEGW